MNIPDHVAELIQPEDTNTFLVSPDGKTLYENFLGEGIQAHEGDFAEMSDDEITDYIIDHQED